MISLAFHGAAGTVTGSKYLLGAGNRKVLIDCGMFQGRKQLRQRNWTDLPFDPTSLSDVILTHAHLDHIGFVPRLVKCGFRGKIYATPPTVKMAQLLLMDAAHIQEEDAEYRNRKKLTSHARALPLFTTEDVTDALEQLAPVPFDRWHRISDEFRFRYHIVGHILGAASVEIDATDGNQTRTVLFSGDVGRYGLPLVVNPKGPPQTDYIVCESTYGDRVHPPADPFFELAELIDDIQARKSVLLIPAFAIGRTQQITYMIDYLIRSGRIKPIKIHIDSPMAVRVTSIYNKFSEFHSLNNSLLRRGGCFYGKNVTLHRKRKSSKTLNKIKGPAVIISASGMMTGGRIMHHLLNRLDKDNTTLAIVGFMAGGTLGAKLAQGDKLVYIHKTPVEVAARIVRLDGLSGHADYMEILHWLEPLKEAPRKVFVTHGEESSSKGMAETLHREKGWECMIPSLDQKVEL